jgi:hypothetical protein
VDELPTGSSQVDEDTACAALLAAELAILALPARSIDDCLIKLMISGFESGNLVSGCDRQAIVNELVLVMDEALQRGRHFSLTEIAGEVRDAR